MQSHTCSSDIWPLQPCDRDGFCNRVDFDLLTSGSMYEVVSMCTKFSFDSSSHFPFRARTNRHTQVTDATEHPIPLIG